MLCGSPVRTTPGIATQNVVERVISRTIGSHPDGPGARRLCGTCLGMGAMSTVVRIHRAAAEGDRVIPATGNEPAFHARRRAVACRPGSVRQAVRKGPDLPGRVHHQLVPPMCQDGARPTRRSEHRETDGRAASTIPHGAAYPRAEARREAIGQFDVDGTCRFDAPGDDARRHRAWPCTRKTRALCGS